MKVLTCAAVRRRIDAFVDGELSVAEQIAVSAHLDWCDRCAALSSDLRGIGATLRASAPGRTPAARPSPDESTWFNAMIVSRLKAEREASFTARVRVMFDDMRLVYVGLSATAAATVCLIMMIGMMRFATEHRPDSLAATLSVMAAPFECENSSKIPDALACRARWLERFQRANETAEQDAVFTLDAIVIHNGRLANLAVLRASRVDASGQAEVVEELLDTVSRARATAPPTDVSPNILRVVARETVRATKQVPLDLTLPPSKPAASLTARQLATA
jgi:hypothetical protein